MKLQPLKILIISSSFLEFVNLPATKKKNHCISDLSTGTKQESAEKRHEKQCLVLLCIAPSERHALCMTQGLTRTFIFLFCLLFISPIFLLIFFGSLFDFFSIHGSESFFSRVTVQQVVVFPLYPSLPLGIFSFWSKTL